MPRGRKKKVKKVVVRKSKVVAKSVDTPTVAVMDDAQEQFIISKEKAKG